MPVDDPDLWIEDVHAAVRARRGSRRQDAAAVVDEPEPDEPEPEEPDDLSDDPEDLSEPDFDAPESLLDEPESDELEVFESEELDESLLALSEAVDPERLSVR